MEEEKISKFVEAITQYAQDQSDRIHDEVEEFKKQRMEQAERQALADAWTLIQKEQVALRANMGRELSRREMDARRQLLQRRAAMMDEVFAAAATRLKTFTESPAYDVFLKQSAAAMPAGAALYVRKEDAGRMPGAQVNKDISLGGILADSGRKRYDDTLDTRLSAQRDWFLEQAALDVTPSNDDSCALAGGAKVIAKIVEK